MAIKREPYVGPRPFEEKDQEVFYGRDQEVDELVSLISAHQAVLLYAQSGVGKTSLVKASLIPTLINKEKFEVLPPARVRSQETHVRSSKINNIYVYNALGYLSAGQLTESQRSKMTLSQFLEIRKQPDRGFLRFVHRRSQTKELAEVPSQCVVIFDQFEELFTLHPERFEDRQAFFEQVSDALQADKVLRVVFAMREDYIAQIDPYVSVLPEKLRTRFRLEPLRKQTALEAIKEPLRERLPNGEYRERSFNGVQRSFGKDVAEQLVANLQTIQVKTAGGENEVLGEFIDPVQLQIVCQTLWRKLLPEDKKITHEHLRLHGDVSKALGDFYETCIAAAAATGKIGQAELRILFERALITNTGRRGMVYRADKDLTVGGIPVASIDEFEDQHLIRAELRSNERWYELSHDRFIQPIRDANKEWRLKQPFAEQKRDELEAKAAEWIRSQRDRSLLLKGAEARDAKDWLNSTEAISVGYSNEVYAFITASQAALDKQRARQMRLAFAGAVAAAILMSVLTVFAFQQRAEAKRLNAKLLANSELLMTQTELAKQRQTEAERAETLALERKQEAEDAGKEAEASKNKAIKLKSEAEDALIAAQKARDEAKKQEGLALGQEKIARSRGVAALSAAKLEDDPELSAALALAALDIEPTRQAEDSLRSALSEQSHLWATFYWPRSSNPFDDFEFTEMHGALPRESVSFTSDGKFVFTSRNGRVMRAELGTGKAPTEHKDTAVSPDGRLLLVAPDKDDSGSPKEHELLVLDASTNRLRAELKGHTAPIESSSFSPDSKFIVTTSADLTARVWNAETGQSLAVLKPLFTEELPKPEGEADEEKVVGITLASISAGGKYAILFTREGGTVNQKVSLWETGTGSILTELTGHKGKVQSASFSPGGSIVATTGDDWTARLWDTSTGKEHRWSEASREPGVLRGHTDTVLGASFSPRGDFVATVSQDKTVRVWNVSTGEVVSQMLGHTNTVNSAAFSPDGELITTAGDATARVWRAKTGEELSVLRGHKGVVNSGAFSPDGRLIATSSSDKTTRVWEVNETQGVTTLSGGGGELYTAEFSPDGQLIVTAGSTGSARIFKADRELLGEFGVQETVFDSAFSPDGKRFLTAGGNEGTAKVWDLDSRKELLTVRHPPVVYRARFSPDGKVFLTTGEDKTVRVWDSNTGMEMKVLSGHTKSVIEAVFSPDGNSILTTSHDTTARIWNWQTGEYFVLKGHTGAVVGAGFSADGRLMATAGTDQTVRIWDTSSRNELRRITGAGTLGGDIGVSFSPNGRFLLTRSDDRTAKVWEVSTGRPVALLRGAKASVSRAEFSPNGKLIITASEDGNARIYPYETFAPLDELLAIVSKTVRKLTDEEREEYLMVAKKKKGRKP